MRSWPFGVKGLDAYQALKVVETLKKLCENVE